MVIFNFLGHIIIGTIVATLFISQPTALLYVLLGSLLPDIDCKTSTLGRFNLLSYFMHHRGKCHTVIGSGILSVPFCYFGYDIASYIFLGCLSHLLGDKIHSIFLSKRGFRLRLW